MDERKYYAVSIKHSINGWKYGKPLVLWGWKRSNDGEERCYAGYTLYPDKAELYALGDFTAHGYNNWGGIDIKDDEPVELDLRFCKKYKKYDTVLVDAERYQDYYKYSVGASFKGVAL